MIARAVLPGSQMFKADAHAIGFLRGSSSFSGACCVWHLPKGAGGIAYTCQPIGVCVVAHHTCIFSLNFNVDLTFDNESMYMC